MNKEKPILFSTPMVKAILEGRKTQTRRIPRNYKDIISKHEDLHSIGVPEGTQVQPIQELFMDKCPYKVGDTLWVREKWKAVLCREAYLCVAEFFDGERKKFFLDRDSDKSNSFASKVGKGWQPSIHMNREATRLFLEVKSVRLERLQDITDSDAIAEGIYEIRKNGWFYCDPAGTKAPNCTLAHKPRQAFMWLWEQINYKRGYEYSWIANPWVWVYEFKRIGK